VTVKAVSAIAIAGVCSIGNSVEKSPSPYPGSRKKNYPTTGDTLPLKGPLCWTALKKRTHAGERKKGVPEGKAFFVWSEKGLSEWGGGEGSVRSTVVWRGFKPMPKGGGTVAIWLR